MIPIGLELLRIELRPLNKTKLKSSDEAEINKVLEICCEAHPKCRCEKECKKLYNELINVMPYERKTIPPSKRRKYPGDWMQATLHRI